MVSSVSTSHMMAALASFREHKQAVAAAEGRVLDETRSSGKACVTALANLKLQRESLQASLKNCSLKAAEYSETGTLAEVVLVLLKRSGSSPINRTQSAEHFLIQRLIQALVRLKTDTQKNSALLTVLSKIAKMQREEDVVKRTMNQLVQAETAIRAMVGNYQELQESYTDVIELLDVRIQKNFEKLAQVITSLAELAGGYMSRGGDLSALSQALFQDPAIQQLFTQQAAAFLRSSSQMC